MSPGRLLFVVLLAMCLTLGALGAAWSEQVYVKCHITCRCSHDDSIGNFAFMIPVDKSPDTGFHGDQACKSYGNRICADSCNGTKFTYTYQVTSP
jgi:hypothetical protein